MGALTLALGLLLILSVSLTPDWTVTATAPEPFGTTTESKVSLMTVTEGEAVVPKNTARCPAAPEKFWPLMVMVLPAAPPLALRPITTGLRFTTSKSPAFRASKPFEAKMSFKSQVRLMLLAAFID